MKDYYDVVVVGAGPAGSVTAKTAAEKGLSVLLIEKRQEIGDPVRCAEGVSKVWLRKHINPDSRWICADVKGSRIFSPDGSMVEMAEEVAGGRSAMSLNVNSLTGHLRTKVQKQVLKSL